MIAPERDQTVVEATELAAQPSITPADSSSRSCDGSRRRRWWWRWWTGRQRHRASTHVGSLLPDNESWSTCPSSRAEVELI
ncbi:hypothetical protein VTO42DRAFT_1953 [Malbranchea cinnamomea]